MKLIGIARALELFNVDLRIALRENDLEYIGTYIKLLDFESLSDTWDFDVDGGELGIEVYFEDSRHDYEQLFSEEFDIEYIFEEKSAKIIDVFIKKLHYWLSKGVSK